MGPMRPTVKGSDNMNENVPQTSPSRFHRDLAPGYMHVTLFAGCSDRTCRSEI